jgi:CheY-like chemotaxis protein
MSNIVLAIDDMATNLLLIEQYLDGEGYDLKCFSSAEAALGYLRSGGEASAILLDRMMPGMDGISFMKAFRALDPDMLVPVIMQTAAATQAQIAEGIAAGAYYYLTKPYSRDVVRAILARALSDREANRTLRSMSAQVHAAMGRLESIEFSFRSLQDVRDVAFILASLYADPQTALLGIREMMLNAVEHGNLGITYGEKTDLVRTASWEQEVERRLSLPENAVKQARARLARRKTEMVLTVEDSGPGFDWTGFMEFDVSRARDPHGRGIAMSRKISFDDVTYVDPGNRVVCRTRL